MVICSGGTGGIISISAGKIILRNFCLTEAKIYGSLFRRYRRNNLYFRRKDYSPQHLSNRGYEYMVVCSGGTYSPQLKSYKGQTEYRLNIACKFIILFIGGTGLNSTISGKKIYYLLLHNFG